MAYTTINKSSDFFNTKLYTGNGSTNAITGVGFQPDMTWLKIRTQSYSHRIYDAVRGVTKYVHPDTTEVEYTTATSLTAFNSDGFTLGSNAGDNKSGDTFASWNWKAGGGQGSSNTDGSINTTYTSVNTTAGFSISKYTGTGSSTTIGHGLGARPDLVITKRLDTTANWVVTSVGSADSTPYQTISSNDANLGLNLTRQVSGSESVGDNRLSTNSSSTIRNIGNHASINASGGTYIAYCFRSITGYSKISSYTGNGNADGTFVYLGFKPSFLMVKRADSTSDWLICDNKRNNYSLAYTQNNFNVVNGKIFANTNQAEEFYNSYDFLSNGFKIRSSGTGHNASGANMIYMAFGQSLVGSNNVPCTAR